MSLFKTITGLVALILISPACGQQTDKKQNEMAADNIFNKGDVLIFQYPDETYGVTIVVEVTLFEEHHDYDFCRTTFKSEKQPDMTNIEHIHAIGYDVPLGTGGTMEVLYTRVVQHACLKKYADKFFKIGIVTFNREESLYGGSSGASDFESFCDRFTEYEWQNNQWSHHVTREIPLKNFIE